MSVAGQPTHLQLPSPTASSQQLYGSLSKWGGTFLAKPCTSDLVAPVECVHAEAETQELAPRSMHAYCPCNLCCYILIAMRNLMAQHPTMSEGKGCSEALWQV